MYYRNRYYDPDTGRFLTKDPISSTDPIVNNDIYELQKKNAVKLAILYFPHYVKHLKNRLKTKSEVENFIASKFPKPLLEYSNGMNYYLYVLSNPVFWTDPYGYCAVCRKRKKKPDNCLDVCDILSPTNACWDCCFAAGYGCDAQNSKASIAQGHTCARQAATGGGCPIDWLLFAPICFILLAFKLFLMDRKTLYTE